MDPTLTKSSQAAQRILTSSFGPNIHTWLVGNAPAAHQVIKPYKEPQPAPGQRTFFMRGRIMAGQVNLEGNAFGWADWKWVARDELEALLRPRLFAAIRNALADR